MMMRLNMNLYTDKIKKKSSLFGQLDFQKERLFTIGAFIVSRNF